MESNEAPEKIYVNFPFGERHPERGPMVTKQGLNAEDTEYTRTDAFIEKACNKLAQLMYNQHLFEGRLHQDAIIENFVNDFRIYMKGEKI